MAKKIASFYNDEINRWLHSVNFYLEEILSIENKLKQIIDRNNIVDIAAKTEVHQLIINKVEEKLINLKKEMETVQKMLSKKEEFPEDKKLKSNFENKISILGISFRHHENEYEDARFFCNEFLEEMLKKGDAG